MSSRRRQKKMLDGSPRPICATRAYHAAMMAALPLHAATRGPGFLKHFISFARLRHYRCRRIFDYYICTSVLPACRRRRATSTRQLLLNFYAARASIFCMMSRGDRHASKARRTARLKECWPAPP